MSVNTNYYNPSYVVSRNPDMYGNRQEDYLKRTNQAIQQTARKIASVKRERPDDLKNLFFEIIEELSQLRQRIALDHGTSSAEDFGARRDKRLNIDFAILRLNGVYEEYNRKLLSRFKEILPSKNLQQPVCTFKHTVEEICLDRKSRIEIEVFPETELVERGYFNPPSVEELLTDFKHRNLMLGKGRPYMPDDLARCWEEKRAHKQNKPKRYEQLRMLNTFAQLQYLIPERRTGDTTKSIDATTQAMASVLRAISTPTNKLHYLHAVFRIEIEGKLYALTHYFTHLNKTDHPLEAELRNTVLMLHQEELLIESTLDEIARVFKRAVLWDKSKDSDEDLKDRMSLLSLLSAHNIRDIRGSAAETEWLENALYQALGKEVSFDKTAMPDLEALCSLSLSEFRKRYHEFVTLKDK